MSESVKVAVRVRPFNQREKDRNAKLIITMPEDIPGKCIIEDPESGKKHEFMFDYAYWSHDKSRSFCSQDVVYQDMGKEILEKAFIGYNITLFAYGQTGSGKSYSMMGAGDINSDQAGIIPRVCQEIFTKISEQKGSSDGTTYKVEASFLEIYNEKIRDLLNPDQDPKKSLQVRESKEQGIFVDGLVKRPVSSYADIERVLDSGNRARTVGATAMNAVSSRSHSVFTLIFTQTKINKDTMNASDITAKINLVDLAGSERAESTGATGDRLKEGCAINKSLSALGNVISALAKNANPALKKKELVPYRNSVLTRLLQESLGGNSITTMIAALSPADINYDETLSTLRYADRAKQIKNVAKRNENPNERIIRELREEVERLKAALAGKGGLPASPTSENAALSELAEKQLRERIENEWQEKMNKAVEEERRKAEELKKVGILDAGDKKEMTLPYLVNLNEDPMLSETCLYEIKDSKTIGTGSEDGRKVDFIVSGVDVLPVHCTIVNEGATRVVTPSINNPPRFRVILYTKANATTYHNGDIVSGTEATAEKRKAEIELKHGDRILLGQSTWFRFQDPSTAKFLEEDSKKRGVVYKAPILDYDYATRELSRKRLGLDKDLAMDEEKEKLLNERIKQLEERRINDAQKKNELEKLQKEKEKQERIRRNKRIFESAVADLLEPVSRANFYSEKLDKRIKYSLDLSATIDKNGELASEVNIKCFDALGERTTLFSPDEFKSRYYIMEEICNELLTFTPDELARYYCGEEVKGFAYDYKEDPFIDLRENAPQLIGNATLLLEPLYYSFPTETKLSLISSGTFSGSGTKVVRSIGTVSVAISPIVFGRDGSIQPDPDWDDCDYDEGDLYMVGRKSGFKLTIFQVMGLPNEFKRNCYCAFNFYDEVTPRKSPVSTKVTSNPEFNWTEMCIMNRTTEDFINYIHTASLVISVYASSTIDSVTSIDKRLKSSRSPASPTSPKSPLSRTNATSPLVTSQSKVQRECIPEPEPELGLGLEPEPIPVQKPVSVPLQSPAPATRLPPSQIQVEQPRPAPRLAPAPAAPPVRVAKPEPVYEPEPDSDSEPSPEPVKHHSSHKHSSRTKEEYPEKEERKHHHHHSSKDTEKDKEKDKKHHSHKHDDDDGKKSRKDKKR